MKGSLPTRSKSRKWRERKRRLSQKQASLTSGKTLTASPGEVVPTGEPKSSDDLHSRQHVDPSDHEHVPVVDDVTMGGDNGRSVGFKGGLDLQVSPHQEVENGTPLDHQLIPKLSGPRPIPPCMSTKKSGSSGAVKISKSKRKKKRKRSGLPEQQRLFPGGASPHSFVRSRANHYKTPPWLSSDEFTAVYSWLYSNKTELMRKGVARVAAWSARCKLPIGIDITAHLCEAFLMEMKYNAGNSYQTLSFGYSIAITR